MIVLARARVCATRVYVMSAVTFAALFPIAFR